MKHVWYINNINNAKGIQELNASELQTFKKNIDLTKSKLNTVFKEIPNLDRVYKRTGVKSGEPIYLPS